MLQTEFEIKLWIDNPDDLRTRLISLGAHQLHPERLFRRVNIDPITGYTGRTRARIRDEGDQITCTLKTLSHKTSRMDCVQELECQISDFDAMIGIFQGLGLHYKNYQETTREKRMLTRNDEPIECCLDRWPGLPLFVEIEGPHQAAVEAVVRALGYEISTGRYGSVDLAYQSLGICTSHEINHRPALRFDNYPGM